ncbi:MAG TPA: hypothetical protein VFL13_04845 [Candidatus Baltobacteraceae bacterium]|nr:hypothetical protein [Candidatus Baltobacteraceae bacterium]
MNDRRDDADLQQTPAQTQSTTQTSAQSVRDETAARDDTGATDVRATGTRTDASVDTTEGGFLPPEQMDDLRSRWSDVQASFVDDPQSAVQQAHDLVTRIVNDLTNTFTRERSSLESQWSGGGEADTEDLRVALQRYRSFFNRLLGS